MIGILLDQHEANGKPIHLVLPAFPFKSPNSKDKVLGKLPDLGEEIALARFDGLRCQIDVLWPGTQITIVSDGLMYNDLLSVSDADVFKYGTTLRKLAKDKYPNIGFARLSQFDRRLSGAKGY